MTTAPNVFMDFTGVTFQPGNTSVDMFSIAENSGIKGLTVNALNVTNYAGNAVKFIGNCQQSDRCYLTNFQLINGTDSTNPQTGTAILFQSDGTHNQTTAFVGPGTILGFHDALSLNSTGPTNVGFINGNNFVGIDIDNAVNCINLFSNPGDVTANSFYGVNCDAGAGHIVGAKGLWIHASTTGVTLEGNAFYGNLWDFGGAVAQAAFTLDSNANINNLQMYAPVGGSDTSSDTGWDNQLWNYAFPLAIQQIGIKNLEITPNPGFTDYWLATNGAGNEACISSGVSPGTDPVCVDGAGDLLSYGNVEVGTVGNAFNGVEILPVTSGGIKAWIDNTGSLIRISTGDSPGTNPVTIDSSGNFNLPGGAIYKVNGSQIASSNLGDSASLVKECGTATFTSGTTSSAVSCSGITSASHCQATWIGSTLTGGALGYTASAGSVTLTAATSNSGTAAVSCSVN